MVGNGELAHQKVGIWRKRLRTVALIAVKYIIMEKHRWTRNMINLQTFEYFQLLYLDYIQGTLIAYNNLVMTYLVVDLCIFQICLMPFKWLHSLGSSYIDVRRFVLFGAAQ